MRCSYCEAEITEYPDNGICIHCGGKLPPRPAGTRCASCGNYSTGNFCSVCGRSLNGTVTPPPVQPVHVPVQPVYIQQPVYISDVGCCPKCRSTRITNVKRGYSWGWGLLGFFLFPVFGLLFGCIGSRKPRLKCTACGHKWKCI